MERKPVIIMKRILVCEDEDVIRDFVVINLQRAGYDVVDVNCGEEALKVLNRKTANSILRFDIMMPGMTASRCKALRRKSSTLDYMLSAKSQEMDKVSGLMLGADDYITSPFLRLSLRQNRCRLQACSISFAKDEEESSIIQAGRLLILKAERFQRTAFQLI